MNKIGEIKPGRFIAAGRLISRKSTRCCARKCAASSKPRSSRTRSPGKSRASCRAKCCAAWAAWAFSASAIRPATADRRWTRSRPWCSRKSSAARPSAGVAITALVHSDMASIHVFRSGSEAQKDKWMPGIIAGEVITAVAVTEPDAGSDVKGIRTFARRDGDSYVIDGAKMFITNGVHADLYCVAAKTDRAGRRAGRSRCFWSRRARPALPSAARSTSTAGARPTPRSCISTTAASRPRTGSAKRAAASTPS